MKIIALDPGLTTGWAIAEWDGSSPSAEVVATGTCHDVVQLGRWLGPNLYVPSEPVLGAYGDVVAEPFDLVVIYETFKLYAHRAHDLIMNDMIASQAIGVIRFLCESRQAHLVPQSAAQGKSITDELLGRVFDTYPRNKHARDACRHAAYYILREVNRHAQDS